MAPFESWILEKKMQQTQIKWNSVLVADMLSIRMRVFSLDVCFLVIKACLDRCKEAVFRHCQTRNPVDKTGVNTHDGRKKGRHGCVQLKGRRLIWGRKTVSAEHRVCGLQCQQ